MRNFTTRGVVLPTTPRCQGTRQNHKKTAKKDQTSAGTMRPSCGGFHVMKTRKKKKRNHHSTDHRAKYAKRGRSAGSPRRHVRVRKLQLGNVVVRRVQEFFRPALPRPPAYQVRVHRLHQRVVAGPPRHASLPQDLRHLYA